MAKNEKIQTTKYIFKIVNIIIIRKIHRKKPSFFFILHCQKFSLIIFIISGGVEKLILSCLAVQNVIGKTQDKRHFHL